MSQEVLFKLQHRLLPLLFKQIKFISLEEMLFVLFVLVKLVQLMCLKILRINSLSLQFLENSR